MYNKISKWAVVSRYENFLIPRVEKSSKISPWEKNLASRGPTAPGRTRFFARGLIFEDFSTLGMKKFPYLKTGPFGNPIFLLYVWGHSITTWTQFCRFLTTFLDLSKYLDVDISSVKWTKRHFLDYLPTSSCPHSH